MQTTSPFNIRQAVKKIKAGEVIAYPTEAVFGLGCDPLNEKAVLDLLNLKKRSIKKGLILIASTLTQLEPYLQLNPAIISQIETAQPEPITWLVPYQTWVPEWLTGKHSKLAIRVIAHPVAKLLCEENGAPLVSTSANIHTKPPATQSWMIPKNIKNRKIFILPGQVGNLNQVTPIYDILSKQQFR